MPVRFYLLLVAIGGLSFGSCTTVDAPIARPVARFQIGCEAIAGLPVEFANISENALSYEWNLGDGRAIAEKSPVIVYPTAGTYVVTMTAIANGGDRDTVARSITIAPAAPPGKRLYLPIVFRRKQEWDWAAVAQMVIHYFGVEVDQCQLESDWTTDDCCIYPELCEKWWVVPQIEKAIRHYVGVDVEERFASLSMEEIRHQITQERPIVVVYSHPDFHHVVLLIGYDENMNVLVHDPITGANWISYERCVNNPQFGSEMIWSRTLYCFRPQ